MAASNVAHKINSQKRTSDVLMSENIDFAGLMLSEPIQRGLLSSGFEKPSPIQLKAIPLGRCGLDLIVQAKSGTGKTCVFAVIALESLQLGSSALQVLVLAPTREIAVQIQDVMKNIGVCLPRLACHTFIGGLPVKEDIQKLKRCHIAIGSPGRVKQLIENGILTTDSIRLFILDEADKLLEESFQEQINWIYSCLPENKQILALSATYPEYLAQHLTAYMRNPTFIRLNISDPALLGIKQYYKIVQHHSLPNKQLEVKTETVIDILSNITFKQCLVFSNFQTRAQNVCSELKSRGWPTTCIAGSLDQKDRLEAMNQLKSYKCRVLISTDLTSRGIDADKVDLVINLDVPYDHETYLHRIGRAGRFGSFGAAISIVSEGKEESELHAVEKKCKTKISALPVPIPNNLVKIEVDINLDDMISTEQLFTVVDKTQIASSELNQIGLHTEDGTRSLTKPNNITYNKHTTLEPLTEHPKKSAITYSGSAVDIDANMTPSKQKFVFLHEQKTESRMSCNQSKHFDSTQKNADSLSSPIVEIKNFSESSVSFQKTKNLQDVRPKQQSNLIKHDQLSATLEPNEAVQDRQFSATLVPGEAVQDRQFSTTSDPSKAVHDKQLLVTLEPSEAVQDMQLCATLEPSEAVQNLHDAAIDSSKLLVQSEFTDFKQNGDLLKCCEEDVKLETCEISGEYGSRSNKDGRNGDNLDSINNNNITSSNTAMLNPGVQAGKPVDSVVNFKQDKLKIEILDLINDNNMTSSNKDELVVEISDSVIDKCEQEGKIYLSQLSSTFENMPGTRENLSAEEAIKQCEEEKHSSELRDSERFDSSQGQGQSLTLEDVKSETIRFCDSEDATIDQHKLLKAGRKGLNYEQAMASYNVYVEAECPGQIDYFSQIRQDIHKTLKNHSDLQNDTQLFSNIDNIYSRVLEKSNIVLESKEQQTVESHGNKSVTEVLNMEPGFKEDAKMTSNIPATIIMEEQIKTNTSCFVSMRGKKSIESYSPLHNGPYKAEVFVSNQNGVASLSEVNRLAPLTNSECHVISVESDSEFAETSGSSSFDSDSDCDTDLQDHHPKGAACHYAKKRHIKSHKLTDLNRNDSIPYQWNSDSKKRSDQHEGYVEHYESKRGFQENYWQNCDNHGKNFKKQTSKNGSSRRFQKKDDKHSNCAADNAGFSDIYYGGYILSDQERYHSYYNQKLYQDYCHWYQDWYQWYLQNSCYPSFPSYKNLLHVNPNYGSVHPSYRHHQHYQPKAKKQSDSEKESSKNPKNFAEFIKQYARQMSK